MLWVCHIRKVVQVKDDPETGTHRFEILDLTFPKRPTTAFELGKEVMEDDLSAEVCNG